MDRKQVETFLRRLERFADGVRSMAGHDGDKRLDGVGEHLASIVLEFRVETAETKRNLDPVKLAGEDSYEVVF